MVLPFFQGEMSEGQRGTEEVNRLKVNRKWLLEDVRTTEQSKNQKYKQN
jgi:hypothetical protein